MACYFPAFLFHRAICETLQGIRFCIFNIPIGGIDPGKYLLLLPFIERGKVPAIIKRGVVLVGKWHHLLLLCRHCL
jgi:hypothetical protein